MEPLIPGLSNGHQVLLLVARRLIPRSVDTSTFCGATDTPVLDTCPFCEVSDTPVLDTCPFCGATDTPVLDISTFCGATDTPVLDIGPFCRACSYPCFGHKSFLWGTLIPQVQGTSGDVFSGFQSKSGQNFMIPCQCGSVDVCATQVALKITSGVTPADLPGQHAWKIIGLIALLSPFLSQKIIPPNYRALLLFQPDVTILPYFLSPYPSYEFTILPYFP